MGDGRDANCFGIVGTEATSTFQNWAVLSPKGSMAIKKVPTTY